MNSDPSRYVDVKLTRGELWFSLASGVLVGLLFAAGLLYVWPRPGEIAQLQRAEPATHAELAP